MGSTSTFAVALLEFLAVGIAAHSAVRPHRLLPCSFKSIGAMFLRLFLVLMGICGAVRQAWTSKKKSHKGVCGTGPVWALHCKAKVN